MRFVENSGVDSGTLAKGYSDTGAIPEDGDDVMNAEAEARKEADEERAEQKMRTSMGFPIEPDVGGFLERNNVDDRY